MSLSPEDWGRQLSRLEDDRAVAVFHTPDLTLQWSNEAYRQLLDEPYRSQGAIGLTLAEYSPIEYECQGTLLCNVGAQGEPESNDERFFSAADGITIHTWSAHRVSSHHVIAVIDVHGPSYEIGALSQHLAMFQA